MHGTEEQKLKYLPRLSSDMVGVSFLYTHIIRCYERTDYLNRTYHVGRSAASA